VLTGTLVSLAILCLLVIVDPSVALAIVTVLGGAYTAVYLAARRKLAVISREQYDASRQKYRSAIEALGGIKDMKVLGREITFLRRYVFYAERHAHNNVLAGVIGQLPRYALEIVAFGGILLVVLHFIGQGRQASQMIPLLALYAFAGYRLLPAMQQLFAALTNLRFSVASLDAVHADLKGSRADNDDAEDRLRDIAAAPTMPFRQEIAFHDVWFKYDGASSAALHGISLEIAANSTIGLVGPTGCGKTTTVDVMLGLLAPSAGALVVDGVPVTGPRVAQWQRNIGYVPQSIYISDDTVARNIAFGVPDEEVDWVAVRRAAQVANLADFVETQLPDAYNTRIGERGVRLSGGQRQRIGIARALYRDPPVLILDEATSALDGITEEAVMDAVRGLARRKTIIIIAHRLTTVRDCDVIYQFDKGVICAKGTFNDLVRESAWFRQAAGM
jgi:ABC-type multidrug transport system fused ATPase/permease subunit